MNLHVCVNKAKWGMPKREFEVVWRMFIHLPVDTGCQCCNHVNYSREHLYVCRWDCNGGHVHRWGGGAVAPWLLAIYALKHYDFPYDPSHTLMWKTEYI